MNSAWNYSSLKPYVKPDLEGLEVRAALVRRNFSLELRYELRAPRLDQLRIPAPGSIADNELWRRTCFELFLKLPSQDAYWEWNFSPSDKANCFRFSSYRVRDDYPVAGHQGLKKMLGRVETPHMYAMEVELVSPGSPLLEWCLATHAPLEASLTAVIEDAQGRLSCWALSHPGLKPDFHDARGFTLKI